MTLDNSKNVPQFSLNFVVYDLIKMHENINNLIYNHTIHNDFKFKILRDIIII